MEASQILQHLGGAVMDYDADAAVFWAKTALAEGIDPAAALGALTGAIRQIGEGFECGEALWLPDLIAAAETMSAATAIFEAEIARTGVQLDSCGTVVIGTVYGDIHDIGKNMVASLMRATGLRVHDLGVNVTAERFVQAVIAQRADVLALSALLTTTAAEQRKVIEALRRPAYGSGEVIVGGGGITSAFAQSIGADGYDATARGGTRLAACLIAR